MRWAALAVVLAAAVGGCGDRADDDTAGGSGDGGATASTPDLAGRSFITTEPADIPGGGPLSMEFTERELRANAGCNGLAGRVNLDGGHLVVESPSMTEMGCPPDRMQADEWLRSFLDAEPTWELSGDDLVLAAGDQVVTLVDREVVDPPLPLIGTTWIVDTLISGESASSVPVGVTASFVIADGQISGNGGCNSFGGSATVDGATVTIGALNSTMMACEGDAGTTEAAVFAVLQGAVTVEIVGSSLRLTGTDGAGLQATAAG